jgi:phospholipid/cholesterol/gamma-HCH transport system ATP-binding protein
VSPSFFNRGENEPEDPALRAQEHEAASGDGQGEEPGLNAAPPERDPADDGSRGALWSSDDRDRPQDRDGRSDDDWFEDDEEPTREQGTVATDRERERATRASVVSEARPDADDPDDEYQWHTGLARPTGVQDAVEFVDVHKAFGKNKILRGLNMGIPDGKISMILGPSGTGKSVCIKHMVGLLYPDDGDVLVHGESVPNMVDDRLFEVRKKFGVLFQDGALFGSMNLFDNVCFPLRQHTDKGEEEIGEIVNARLQEVGLEAAADKYPNELSGGMRKRAGFARALVLDPDIVLFDEPDSGLDPVRTALLCELIQEIHQENGGAYVVITHDIMSARRVAEHISVLWKGRIVESGPAEELFESDNAFVRQFLSGESQGPLGME